MRFIADCMLGRLARWLRVLGFDVLYFSRAEDADLLEVARREGRIFLTRDSGLIEKNRRRPGRLFIASQKWDDQVVQVLGAFGLWDEVRPHSRCLVCNLELKPIPRSRARNLVPPFVLETAERFALCPGCGRVFWEGSHSGDMEAKIRTILKRRPAPASARKPGRPD